MTASPRFDHKEARRLRGSGETLEQIAAALGVSHVAVWKACRGIPKPHPGVDVDELVAAAKEAGATYAGLGRQFGVSTTTVRRHLIRLGRLLTWTPGHIEDATHKLECKAEIPGVDVEPLPVRIIEAEGVRRFESAWLPNEAEVAAIVRGASIHLSILATQHPPVGSRSAPSPFDETTNVDTLPIPVAVIAQAPGCDAASRHGRRRSAARRMTKIIASRAELQAWRDAGEMLEQIAAKFGCTRQAIYGRLVKDDQPRKAEAVADQIVEGYAAGRSGRDIAAEHGVHPTSVFALLGRRGVKRRPRGNPDGRPKTHDYKAIADAYVEGMSMTASPPSSGPALPPSTAPCGRRGFPCARSAGRVCRKGCRTPKPSSMRTTTSSRQWASTRKSPRTTSSWLLQSAARDLIPRLSPCSDCRTSLARKPCSSPHSNP